MLLAQEDQAPFEHIITTMDSLSSWKRVSRVCAGVQVLGGPQQFRHHLTRLFFNMKTIVDIGSSQRNPSHGMACSCSFACM